MRNSLLSIVAVLSLASVQAAAQVPQSTYSDANRYLDVQKLTCRQLAGTFQEDADLLVAWYSGWYNGLTRKHLPNPDEAKRLEHDIIVHCKTNPDIRVIDAVAVIFKDERMRLGQDGALTPRAGWLITPVKRSAEQPLEQVKQLISERTKRHEARDIDGTRGQRPAGA
ncbi:HdeA/HdeB family chaperone [Bradyrhizobium sp. HKCCYLRH2015]|uniref:HdeA/HdeB family chaperone n=1 Tax=Bradyrhizobium sp. HKCCYLRH2015 TaxID=3420742 RepID=UPI003EB9E5CC